MNKIVSEVLEIYTKGKDRWSKSTNDSILCSKFVLGDQWSASEKEYLKKTGRPTDVVYNKLLPRLNTLIGIEEQNRRSIKIRAAKEEYDELAVLMNQLFIGISNNTNMEDSISLAFKTGLITPLPAWIEIGTKLNDNSHREYTFTVANSYMITPDPTFKDYSLKDCNWIIKEKWMTAEDIKGKYNKTVSKLETRWWEKLVNTDEIYSIWNRNYPQNEYFDKSENTFKVLELQEKVYVKRIVFMNQETLEYVSVPEEDSKKYYKDKTYIYASETNVKRIHIKTIVPYVDMVLLDEMSEFETEMFDVIPYMSFDYNHIKCESSSFINTLIPIQKSYNKREVQYLAFLDHSISAPIFFHNSDKETKEEYDKTGNKPNASFLYRNMKSAPFRLQPNQVPYSIKEKLIDDEQNMNDISAINASMRGESEYSEESGRLFNMKNKVAGVTSNHYFANLSKTRKMVGEYILSTVKDVYGQPDRMADIGNNDGDVGEVILNMDMGDGRIINNISDFKGKIVIDEGEQSTTYRENAFMQKMALVNMFGIELIKPEWLLKDSELADWKEQVEYMNMIMGIQSENQAREQALAEDGQVLDQLTQEKALSQEQSTNE